MKTLAVIILNYRRGDMTLESLASLEPDMAGRDDRCAVVVDNGSDDDSADVIERGIAERGWGDWVTLVRRPDNGGFAAGNNTGFEAVDAASYLLLNSDARVRPGAIDALLSTLAAHPEAGMIGPRLEDPDGTPQVSCFRWRTPLTELLEAAGTGPLDRWFADRLVATGIHDAPCEGDWVSFACILIRRAVIEQIGPMDDGYFMYFEDIDYARTARRVGWTVLHDPTGRVVHLRGGTSSVKSARTERRRVPGYYYRSRSRYFARFYGGVPGLWFTNLCWLTGRTIALVRELVGAKRPHACTREARDNWTNWWRPMQASGAGRGGEL